MHFSKVQVQVNEGSPDKLLSFFDGTFESSSRPTKRRRLTANEGQCTLDTEVDLRDYLTIATVDIELIFANDDAQAIPNPPWLPQDRKFLPVVLKTFKKERDGRCHCHIINSEGMTLVNAYIDSSIASQSMKVLASATEPSSASRRKKRGVRIVSMISNLDRGQNRSGFVFKLGVKILVHDSGSLAEGSSDVRDLLDLCVPQEISAVWDPWSPRDFYDNVFVPDRNDSPHSPKIDQLNCQLYPFQVRAIRWLLRREGVVCNGKNLVAAQKETADTLPHGFFKTVDLDGRDCFGNHFLGVMTTNRHLVEESYADLKGGILAEEMGLGKTVEICALICLHQQNTIAQTPGIRTGPLQDTPATLIITPPSILKQWKNELRAHSPDLKVMAYNGIRREAAENSDSQFMERFRGHDVVLTTYSVLAAEIHHAPAPSRDLRHEKKYERRLSPITQIMWWRVVLDEAQMIEGGSNNAAKVAQLIPRRNAWAVSGTPVRKDARDLLGLLVFLRFQPYCQSPQLWDYLVARRRDIFKEIFRNISLRHTKEQIKDDIQLPPQKRVVISIPFTQIEEQHYSELYQQMCDDCGLDLDGAPVSEAWDPKSPVIIQKMRNWLARLRQTCLHPEVGTRNRRALGGTKGPLRTVGEVLEVMVEQNLTACRAEERSLLLSQVRRGQLLEHAKRSRDALDIWLRTLEESRLVVEDCRQRLKSALDESAESQTTETPESEALITARTGVHRQRLRSALEVEHMSTFFVANAYYQIKTDLNLTEPDSRVFKDLEKLEEDSYERAKLLRRELLTDTHKKAEISMNKVKEKFQNESFIEIPDIKPLSWNGGIESRNMITAANHLISVLQDEASQFNEWRNKLIDLLLLPLVDQENAELRGDEYEESTMQQDQVYAYMDALRLLAADRHELLTGQINARVEHEMHVALQTARQGGEHSATLIRTLLSVRGQLKPSKKMGFLRGVITELRDLNTSVRSQAENGNTRAAAEVTIVQASLQNLHEISIEQTKTLSGIDRELEIFKDTMNSRLDYYRQLQQISDTLTFDGQDLDEVDLALSLANMQQAEGKMRDRIATIKAKERYLFHLRNEATMSGSQRMCIICQQPFEVGVLTSCGHSFCVECLRLWWGAHRNCPTCKKHLSRNDLNQITYKPKEFVVEEESPSNEDTRDSSTSSSPAAIYSDIQDVTLNQIKNIDVDGSFGTKIDTLARHMLWIRANDPGVKSIVFSQYRDFLDILAKAFSRFKIAFTGIDQKDGIDKFKEDPSVECFFLHAKAHSSGLNLVNATHVFLCEPLINTAIELQAIARVHRIGQHHSTTVWMYLVENTVERSIYEISANRRMSHIGKPRASSMDDEADKGNAAESEIEAANSLELQAPLSKLLTKESRGGEMVSEDDLWDCLFRQRAGKSMPIRSSLEADE